MLHLVRKAISAALLALAALAVGALAGRPTRPPIAPGGGDAEARLHDLITDGVDRLAEVHPMLATAGTGLWRIGLFLLAHPLPVLAAIAVLCLPSLVASLIRFVPHRVFKDPQRMFSKAQRDEGSRLAAGRCEMEGLLLFTRCHRPGAHADHWFPHTLGGASTMQNLVHACAPCNLSKGARVPTFWETTRLEWRRRRYYTREQRRPGDKYRRR